MGTGKKSVGGQRMKLFDCVLIGLCSKTRRIMLVEVVQHKETYEACVQDNKTDGWCHWAYLMDSGVFSFIDRLVVKHYRTKIKLKNTKREVLKMATNPNRWEC